MLVGDALQARAFELVASARRVPAAARASTSCAVLARAAGWRGMVGGQYLDIDDEPPRRGRPAALRDVHDRKTGALIAGAVEAGAVAAGASAEVRAAFAALRARARMAVPAGRRPARCDRERANRSARRQARTRRSGKVTAVDVFGGDDALREAVARAARRLLPRRSRRRCPSAGGRLPDDRPVRPRPRPLTPGTDARMASIRIDERLVARRARREPFARAAPADGRQRPRGRPARRQGQHEGARRAAGRGRSPVPPFVSRGGEKLAARARRRTPTCVDAARPRRRRRAGDRRRRLHRGVHRLPAAARRRGRRGGRRRLRPAAPDAARRCSGDGARAHQRTPPRPRDLLPWAPDLLVCDASFIPLGTVLPAVLACMDPAWVVGRAAVQAAVRGGARAAGAPRAQGRDRRRGRARADRGRDGRGRWRRWARTCSTCSRRTRRGRRATSSTPCSCAIRDAERDRIGTQSAPAPSGSGGNLSDMDAVRRLYVVTHRDPAVAARAVDRARATTAARIGHRARRRSRSRRRSIPALAACGADDRRSARRAAATRRSCSPGDGTLLRTLRQLGGDTPGARRQLRHARLPVRRVARRAGGRGRAARGGRVPHGRAAGPGGRHRRARHRDGRQRRGRDRRHHRPRQRARLARRQPGRRAASTRWAPSPATAWCWRRPSGSTAYNLSNGGPVMAWGVEGTVVSFVAPHTLAARPLVVAPSDMRRGRAHRVAVRRSRCSPTACRSGACSRARCCACGAVACARRSRSSTTPRFYARYRDNFAVQMRFHGPRVRASERVDQASRRANPTEAGTVIVRVAIENLVIVERCASSSRVAV